MEIWDLLRMVVHNQASDLHLSAELPPMQRVHGEMCHLALPVLSSDEVGRMLASVMSEAQRAQLAQYLECDFSFDFSEVGRFRVNAFHQNRGLAAVFRVIPSKVPNLDELKAPIIFKDIANSAHGLVLVTGATGSGKSTTLAAMVDSSRSSSASMTSTRCACQPCRLP